MSDAESVARLSVELHEQRSHSELMELIAGLRGQLDEACAQAAAAQDALDAHLGTYHAPEPEPEPEPAPEPEPEPAPAPDKAPKPEGIAFRRLGGRRDEE